MEDLKKLLLEQNDYSMSSSEGKESDDEELSIWNLEKQSGEVPLTTINSNNRVNAIASKKRNGEERLPTRRPDPNVYNRNALLARENRRKKKMYLESIEKELQNARKANRTLLKALKHQLKVARRLEQEVKYFQGLFANRSEILSLVSAINVRRLPTDSSKSPFSTTSNFGYDNTCSFSGDAATTPSCSSSSHDPDPLSIHFDNLSDGSVTVENPSSSSDFSSFDFCTFPDFFTDLEDATDCGLPSSTTWSDLWNNNGYHNDVDDFPSQIISSPCANSIHTVNNDHCYGATSRSDLIQTFRQQTEFTSTSPHTQSSLDLDVGTEYVNAGTCLHNAGGKVSIEFCPTCHWNLSNSRTPPLQLFNDEALV